MDDLELVATENVIEKLKVKHDVELLEVEEALFNFEGTPLADTREDHKTRPLTIWFLSFTTEGRLLKIVGIPFTNKKEFVLKTAYEPDSSEIDFYEKNQ